MKFQKKIKASLLTLLLLRDHKFNEVLKYVLLYGGKRKEIDTKTTINLKLKCSVRKFVVGVLKTQ